MEWKMDRTAGKVANESEWSGKWDSTSWKSGESSPNGVENETASAGKVASRVRMECQMGQHQLEKWRIESEWSGKWDSTSWKSGE